MEIIEKEIVKKIKYLKFGKIERPLAQVKDFLEGLYDGRYDNSMSIIEDIQLRDALEKEDVIEIVDPIDSICKIGENYEMFLGKLSEGNC